MKNIHLGVHFILFIYFSCRFVPLVYILCWFDYLPAASSTHRLHFLPHTHTLTYARHIRWTLIAFEQRIQPSVRTRCFASKWPNKEYFPFFYSFLVCITVVGTTIGSIVYCLHRRKKCEWKKGPFHFHHYLMCCFLLRKSNKKKEQRIRLTGWSGRNNMEINRNTFEANFRFNRLVVVFEEANTKYIFSKDGKRFEIFMVAIQQPLAQ